jgi:hypothetical protein
MFEKKPESSFGVRPMKKPVVAQAPTDAQVMLNEAPMLDTASIPAIVPPPAPTPEIPVPALPGIPDTTTPPMLTPAPAPAIAPPQPVQAPQPPTTPSPQQTAQTAPQAAQSPLAANPRQSYGGVPISQTAQPPQQARPPMQQRPPDRTPPPQPGMAQSGSAYNLMQSIQNRMRQQRPGVPNNGL